MAEGSLAAPGAVVFVKGGGLGLKRMKRKSMDSAYGCREPKPDSICADSADIGVDLNRNFDAAFWGSLPRPQSPRRGTGAAEGLEAEWESGQPCCSNFRGPLPFSEPETRAFRDTFLKFTALAEHIARNVKEKA